MHIIKVFYKIQLIFEGYLKIAHDILRNLKPTNSRNNPAPKKTIRTVEEFRIN